MPIQVLRGVPIQVLGVPIQVLGGADSVPKGGSGVGREKEEVENIRSVLRRRLKTVEAWRESRHPRYGQDKGHMGRDGDKAESGGATAGALPSSLHRPTTAYLRWGVRTKSDPLKFSAGQVFPSIPTAAD